jgi:hypothetical protein
LDENTFLIPRQVQFSLPDLNKRKKGGGALSKEYIRHCRVIDADYQRWSFLFTFSAEW